MEPTSTPDNARPPRGVGRFWPAQGSSAPPQRHSDEDGREEQAGGQPTEDDAAPPVLTSHSGSAQAGSAAQPAHGQGTPPGETEMVALGSRRSFEPAPNGSARWGSNQGGFPPIDAEREARNGEPGPRHGGGPVPNGLPPAAGRPPARSTFGPPEPSAREQDGAPGEHVPPPPFGPVPGAPAAFESAPGSPAPFQAAPGSPAPFPSAPGSPGPYQAAPGSPAPFGPAHGSPVPFTPPPPAMQDAGTSSPFRADDARPGPAGADDGTEPGGRRRSADDDPRSGSPERRGGRAETPAGRPATGWASVPTSGVPQINGAARPGGSARVNGAPFPGGEPGTVHHTNGVSFGGDAGTPGRAPAVPATTTPHGPDTTGGRQDIARAGTAAATGPDPAGDRDRDRDRDRDDILGLRDRGDGLRDRGDEATDDRRGDHEGRGDHEDRGDHEGRGALHGKRYRDGGEHDRPWGDDLTGRATVWTEPEEHGARRGDPPGADRGRAVSIPADQPRDPAPPRSSSLADAGPARPGGHGTEHTGDAARAGTARLGAPAHGDRTAPRGTSAQDVRPGPLRPGDVGLGQIAFWDEEAVAHFRSEWHEVKAAFVDDPVTALTSAHDLLTDAVSELTEALLAERDELDPLRATATPDTESMRMAMRGYREFLDRILAL